MLAIGLLLPQLENVLGMSGPAEGHWTISLLRSFLELFDLGGKATFDVFVP